MQSIKDELEQSIRQDVIQCLSEHKKNLDLEKLVKQFFDKGVEQVILSLMGFEKDNWSGRWKVDHCNGRQGSSVVGDDIQNKARAELQKFVNEKMNIVDLWSTLSKKEIEDLKHEYRETYIRQLRENLRDWGARDARTKFEEIFGDIVEEILTKEVPTIQVKMENAIVKKKRSKDGGY